MSRIANKPIEIPKGVEVTLSEDTVLVKGSRGELSMRRNDSVEVKQEDNLLSFSARFTGAKGNAMAGTTRALVNNMVVGVTSGFEKRLQLVGVGYRAQIQGSKINLTLGFSHPVEYNLPEGVNAEMPSATEIILTSTDKQLLGQAAAEIRQYRPPEPYKGKGVRYADEYVRRKEAKKK